MYSDRPDVQRAAGHVDVARGERPHDPADRYVVGRQPVGVELDPDLPLPRADDVDTSDPADVEDLVPQVLRDLPENRVAHVPAEADREDRDDLAQLDRDDLGILGLIRDLRARVVDGGPQVEQPPVELVVGEARLEADIDDRPALPRRRGDVLDVLDALDLLLERLRDERLHLLGRHPGIDDDDDGLVHVDVRKQLGGHAEEDVTRRRRRSR